MTATKLETTEIDKVLDIINEYRSIHAEINSVEQEIAVLMKRKDKVLAKYTSLRNSEEKLTKKLKKKYGPGKVDPNTMSWTGE